MGSQIFILFIFILSFHFPWICESVISCSQWTSCLFLARMYRFLFAKPDSVGQAENNFFFSDLDPLFLVQISFFFNFYFLFFFCSRGFACLSGFLIKTNWLIKDTSLLNLFCTLLQEFSHSLLLSLFSPADVFTRFFIVLDSFYHHQSIPPPGLVEAKGQEKLSVPRMKLSKLEWAWCNTWYCRQSQSKGFDYLF